MSLRTDLQAFLISWPRIAAIVAKRVYWLRAPQGVQNLGAFITFQRIAGTREHVLHGMSRLATPIYQIDGWTRDPNQIEALSDAILSIDGFVGMMGATSVRDVLLVSDRELDEAPDGGGDEGPLRCSYDFEIWHGETVPG